jgi:hypothetical protein
MREERPPASTTAPTTAIRRGYVAARLLEWEPTPN